MGKGNAKEEPQAGCYVRVSTENQLENYSIEEQTRRLMAYCAARDIPVRSFYIDPGCSGGSLNRPALQRLLHDIRDKKINRVVVYKLDRLSRSQKDTLQLIEDEFFKNGVDFISVVENFDTATPMGRAMIGILSVFAQLEKEQIAERFTMGRLGRCRAGFYHGGPTAPTGYRYEGGELLVDEKTAPQVREAFRLFLSGYSIHAVTGRLHEKYGGWTSHTLTGRVLKNSVYIGKVTFKGLTFDGRHQPIINEADFWEAQARLSSPKREGEKNEAQRAPFRAGSLLAGLLVCGRCGAGYSAVHGSYRCYSRSKCARRLIRDPHCQNTSWPIGQLDKIITDALFSLPFDKFFPPAESTAAPAEAAALMREAARLEEEMEKIKNQNAEKAAPLQAEEARLAALTLGKEALLTGLADQTPPALNLPDPYELFLAAPLPERQLFLSCFIGSVVLEGSRVEIVMNL